MNIEDEELFEKKLKENMSAAFDTEGLKVSDDLIKRTLAAIDQEKVKTTSGKKLRNRIYVFSGLAAACLVVVVGWKLFAGSQMKSETKSGAMMDSVSETMMDGTENSALATYAPEAPAATRASDETEIPAEAEDTQKFQANAFSGSDDEDYEIYEIEETTDREAVSAIKNLIDDCIKEEIDVNGTEQTDMKLKDTEWTGEVWLYTEQEGIIVYSFSESDILYRITYFDDDKEEEVYYRTEDVTALYEDIKTIIKAQE